MDMVKLQYGLKNIYIYIYNRIKLNDVMSDNQMLSGALSWRKIVVEEVISY